MERSDALAAQVRLRTALGWSAMTSDAPLPVDAALPLPLVSRTTAVDPATLPRDLLDLLPADGGTAWIRRGDGLVGWGELARIALSLIHI